MLNLEELQKELPIGSLGEPLHFFESAGSTNDIALGLAGQGAPAGTLVLANEQTAGRGRLDRSWSTPRGVALALSLILRPGGMSSAGLMALNALGALAVAEAVEELALNATIKWPNDVLIGQRKAAGVLVEAAWRGDEMEYAVLGIGVNVKQGSAPPDRAVRWPATSLEAAAGRSVGRVNLLARVLRSLDRWLEQLGSVELQQALERRLAYVGQTVEVRLRSGLVEGTLLGLSAQGQLRLLEGAGKERVIGGEFVSLWPLDKDRT